MDKNIILSNLSLDTIIDRISEQVAKVVINTMQSEQPEIEDNFKSIFDKYIPKTEVRDVLASNSTLWQWEKAGKLKLYAIGGKRFYKRSDIENLFQEVNHKKKGAKK